MRIVCYAVNGSGIGHLKRLTAIARHLRRHAEQFSLPLEIFFLTSSEASHLLLSENFASFKFPSREVLDKSKIEIESFTKIVKRWTAATLEVLQPDLLLVDTFPDGYYNELIENLSLCRKTAIIHRPLKFDNLDKVQFYGALKNYDSIIVPEIKETIENELPVEIENKTEYFGAVMCREKDELFDRKTVRNRLNIPDDDYIVYLSAGGGGDKEAESRIKYLHDSLVDLPNMQFIIGGGALYQGRKIYAPNVIWLANENAFELMPGFDMAISAAGYNSFYELLFAGVPTIFIPQQKWADDQLRRAKKTEQTGAAFLFEKLPDKPELQNIVERLKDIETRRMISQKAQDFVSFNYASKIARYLFDRLL